MKYDSDLGMPFDEYHIMVSAIESLFRQHKVKKRRIKCVIGDGMICLYESVKLSV